MSWFDKEELTLTASVASGIEAVLKRELSALGYEYGGADYGRIDFIGSFSDVAKANVHLRTANRIYIKLCSFPASTFNELYDGLRYFDWSELFPSDARLIVNAKSIKSTLFALSSIQSISKKAIVEGLKEKLKVRTLTESGSPYLLEVNIINDVATVYLDTSGTSLHRRGYRTMVGQAPLRETLAAAILMLSNWTKDKAFIDPFVGSGTFPIEAALIASNTPAGINRDFAFSSFDFAPKVLDLVKEEALEGIIEPEVRISGFDIDPSAIKLANYHAERAGVSKLIHLQTMDMRKLSSRFAKGVMVTNPPYGERLLSDRELRLLYADFGKLFASFNNWSLYAITGYVGFEKYFGRKADKTRKLFNAELECRLYQYFSKRTYPEAD